jgi:hypothetical protein
VDYATDWVTVNLTGLATESWVTAGFYPLTGNPSAFLTASALTPYLTSATAASTYQTLAGMSAYLTTSAAAAGYYPLSGNPSGFLTAASLSGYATESFVTSQGYITASALAGYATESWVTSQGYLTSAPVTSVAGRTGAITLSNTDISGLGSLAVVNDAPSDGSQYARKNGAWDVVTATSSYISSVSSPLSVTSGNLTIDLSAYAQLSGATFTGNVFAPTPSPGTDSTRIATTEWVKDFDYAPTNSPHFTGNPKSVTPSTGDDDTSIATTAFVKAQNYITSSALTGYATESWVTTELSDYLTTATAASTYYPLTNPDNYLTSYNASFLFYPLSSNPAGYLTSAPVTSVAGRTGAITLANTDISGLGTMATATASDYSTTTVANGLYYPLSSNPAGYLTSAPVTSVAGRTGAITLAVADVSGAAPLASPTFSGTPSLPTGTIGVTQTAGNNTTALATTAFVTAAVPAFATAAQVVTGTSTTTALAPGNAGFLKADPRLRSLAHISFTRVSGSGAVAAGSVALGIREMYLGSLATGLAGFSYGWTGLVAANMSAADWNKVDFSKKIWMSGVAMCGATLGATNYIGDSNTRNRVTLGGYNSDTTSGDMSVKGIGWKKVGGTSSFFTLTVHNGTTLTDVATSVTQTAGKVINWVIYSDGTGNVTLYIDGVQAATTSAGPTGTSNTLQATYREQVEAVATPTVRAIMECSGGWIYLAD